MTRDELKARYPNASDSFIRRNLDAANSVPNPQPEPPVRNVAQKSDACEERGSKCIKVRVTSFRCRLLDIDNLAGGSKFLIDALRYQGFIRDDSPDAIELSFAQFKVRKRSQEETIVIISSVAVTPAEAAIFYASAYAAYWKEKYDQMR